MKVLTVYAHHDRQSFCHGVLERFTAGLIDAGHSNEVVDLYAIKFDPVYRDRDVASYTSGTVPADILELMDLEHQVLRSCRGPLQRFLATRAMRGKSSSEIAAMIRSHMLKDAIAQQQKVAAADALAFIPRSTSATFRRSSKAGSTACSRWTSRSGSPRRAGVVTSTDESRPASPARAHHDLDDL